ncbi:hypothetical protein Tco_0148156, partial [Tanacetum coccineum]
RFWYEERIKNSAKNARPKYHRCCMGGRVVLRTYQVYPEYIKLLLTDALLLPAPTPVQSSIPEALPQHSKATVTTEDNPTQITPNQPINPTSPTTPTNQDPMVLSSFNTPPVEQSTPPTKKGSNLSAEKRNRNRAIKKLSTQGTIWERRNT